MKQALDACNAAGFSSYEASKSQAKPIIREADLKQACGEIWPIEQKDIRQYYEKENENGRMGLFSSPPGKY